jgi:hypothetical protein
MKTLLILLLIAPPCFACNPNASEDMTYTEGSVTYECPSEVTLNKRALKQAQEQAIVDAKKATEQKDLDLQAIDLKSVRALRAVMAKSCDGKDADCQILKTKEAEAKAVREK